MKSHKVIVTSLALCAAVSACSTTPKRINELEDARTTVQQVESSPLAGQYASQEVERAHDFLREADRLAGRNAPLDQIQQSAYLAKRHAQIAEEQIAGAQAKQEAQNADAQRQQILLQAQANKADAAQRTAEVSADEAKRRAEMLQEELDKLKAKKTDRGLVLTLGDVLFDTGKSTLKPGAMSTIDRLAMFLKEAPERTVVIEGHTDSVGSDEYNLELSQRRAGAVKAALLERGIQPDRIEAVGKGKEFPVAGNDTAGGRQQNRRVEIVISDDSRQASAG